MLKIYLKIGWRNLFKNKVFSVINISGLAIGFTCCMLIALYLVHETSYDSQHTNINRLYQVGTTFVVKGEKDDKSARTSAPIAQAMKEEFPEVAEVTRLVEMFADDKTLLRFSSEKGEVKSFYETKGYLADPSFFKLFTYQFIEGNSSTALNGPNTVVLSEIIAKKLFGNQRALGKRIHISSNSNGEYDYTVAGVFHSSDRPSHIDVNFFLSIKGGDVERYICANATDFASNNMFFSYLLLKPGADPKTLESKFPAFVQKYAGKDLAVRGFNKKQFLIPVKDIHLTEEMRTNVTPAGSATYLYILASIAFLALLIACVNFMNLSTARSSSRSLEVGVRKVLGADRGSLIRQFLGESMILTMLSFFVAIGVTKLVLPLFSSLSGKNIQFGLEQVWLWPCFLLLALVTGFIAGSYPAFYLSSFKPVKVLKAKVFYSRGTSSLRKGLVAFQFAISVVLIIASVVIAGQMNYLQEKDLGFAKDRQFVIPLRSQPAKDIYTSLKNAVRNHPQVLSTGASMYYPGIFNPSDNAFYKAGESMTEAKRTRMNWVDPDFMNTLGLQPKAGRLFSSDFPADTAYQIVINEETVKQLGFTSAEEAVGNKIYFDWQGRNYPFDIIGVVKDFHFEDMHLPIAPYGFRMVNGSSRLNYMLVHIKDETDMNTVLGYIRNEWNKLNPGEPFEYSFLDDDFQKNYEADSRLASIVNYFTGIAILISCLGLFGLATFSTEQRRKEIGVRKVLGAGVINIVRLLSVDFLKPVLLSFLIAFPAAWYLMNSWLENFAYKISIHWWVFALAAFSAVLLALFTVSIQAIKTALANPVKSLRTE